MRREPCQGAHGELGDELRFGQLSICELCTQTPLVSGWGWPWRGPMSTSLTVFLHLGPFTWEACLPGPACCPTGPGHSVTPGSCSTPSLLGTFPSGPGSWGIPPCEQHPPHATQENCLYKPTHSATLVEADVFVWLEFRRWRILQPKPIMTIRKLWCRLSSQIRKEPGSLSHSQAPFLLCLPPQPDTQGRWSCWAMHGLL